MSDTMDTEAVVSVDAEAREAVAHYAKKLKVSKPAHLQPSPYTP
jgi:hypothetical protein